ncbi:MAG TPA: hypothetical protein DEA96_03340 [Leptospiraceae bacterium]|nr:hypothetical protein [Spirochaetaceae bacterium]HBS03974.1 hypothetical protein [Leptospiraceae bacterium]|tara:strand:- start:1405 stop:1599 length:195 start_codon:yes stop_codon:yes gene_type:complete
MALQPGDEKTLDRPTFLHEGVFVIQGTLVRVVEVSDGGQEVVVEYTDKEGFPHYIKGIRPEELI